jgi:membrane-bound lytic murein transglycosylase A
MAPPFAPARHRGGRSLSFQKSIAAVALAMVPWLAACVTPKPATKFEPEAPKNYARELPPGAMALEKVTDPSQYPEFGRDGTDRTALIKAIEQSLAYLEKPSAQKHYPYLDVSFDRVKVTLETFLADLKASQTASELQSRVTAKYDVYRSVGCDGQGTVLFTGYCEPIFDGSRKPSATYRYPLYRAPPDLVKGEEGTPLGRRTAAGSVVPYYTREEIETKGLLKGKGLELVYLKDPFEVYIVHVQGSARIRLEDGSMLSVGYAGKTDRPYASAGAALIRDGKIAKGELSLRTLKDYFKSHPAERDHYLFENQSYVFFAETSGGPFGSLNVPVTAMRSIATDKAVFPRAALAFADTQIPVRTPDGRYQAAPFKQFVLDQDTGGAIRSAGRTDIFFGTGPEAEDIAGHTQYEGKLFYVFLKEPVGKAQAVP